MSSCTNSTRAAEQRWPALSKAERTQSRTTCSGSALESAIMALMPPVSAMKGTMALAAVGQRPLDGPGRLVGAGEGDAVHARILDQRRAEPAAARQQVQDVARHARLVQQLRRQEGGDRRLLGGLGQHRRCPRPARPPPAR